jgi:hypothetical protein
MGNSADHSTSWTSRDELTAVCARHLEFGEHAQSCWSFAGVG